MRTFAKVGASALAVMAFGACGVALAVVGSRAVAHFHVRVVLVEHASAARSTPRTLAAAPVTRVERVEEVAQPGPISDRIAATVASTKRLVAAALPPSTARGGATQASTSGSDGADDANSADDSADSADDSADPADNAAPSPTQSADQTDSADSTDSGNAADTSDSSDTADSTDTTGDGATTDQSGADDSGDEAAQEANEDDPAANPPSKWWAQLSASAGTGDSGGSGDSGDSSDGG
jgi:hypothetical protein